MAGAQELAGAPRSRVPESLWMKGNRQGREELTPKPRRGFPRAGKGRRRSVAAAAPFLFRRDPTRRRGAARLATNARRWKRGSQGVLQGLKRGSEKSNPAESGVEPDLVAPGESCSVPRGRKEGSQGAVTWTPRISERGTGPLAVGQRRREGGDQCARAGREWEWAE
jgi:hypothetical protein